MSYEVIASVLTVVSFVTFMLIVVWALSRRRREAFAAAEQLPFILRDEFESDLADQQRKAS